MRPLTRHFVDFDLVVEEFEEFFDNKKTPMKHVDIGAWFSGSPAVVYCRRLQVSGVCRASKTLATRRSYRAT